MRVIVHRTPDWPRTLRDDWRALFDADSTATPFQSWEWNSIWWNRFGRSRSPYLLAAYMGDDLVGLLPLIRAIGPWRTLRSMAVGPSDYLGPIAQPTVRQAVVDAFLEHLKEAPADMIDLHQWTESTGFGDPVDQATCLRLDLPPTFDGYLGGLSKSLRYDVRRLERTDILKIHQPEVAAALDVLFDLHVKRWRSRGLPGVFGRRIRKFHEEWAEAAKSNGWLRLSVLEHEGHSIGAIYAMTRGGRCYYYQAGFDPAASKLSPGTLLVASTIRHAIEEGVTTFDFCRGDEPYKRRWKPQSAVVNQRLLFATKQGVGRLGERWNRMAWRVENHLRERFEGGSLTLVRKKSPESPVA